MIGITKTQMYLRVMYQFQQDFSRQYTDSDEVSEGIRTFFFDIEVEVVDGFSDVMKRENNINAIL